MLRFVTQIVLILCSSNLAAQNDISYYQVSEAFRAQTNLNQKMLDVTRLNESLSTLTQENFVARGTFTFPEGINGISDRSLKRQVTKAVNENLERELLRAYRKMMVLELEIDGILRKIEAHNEYIDLISGKIEAGLASQWDLDVAKSQLANINLKYSRYKTALQLSKKILSGSTGIPIAENDSISDPDFLRQAQAPDLDKSDRYIRGAQSTNAAKGVLNLLKNASGSSSRYRLQFNYPYFVFMDPNLQSGATLSFTSKEDAERKILLANYLMGSNLTAAVTSDLLSLNFLASQMSSTVTQKLSTEKQLKNLDTLRDRGQITDEEWIARKIQYLEIDTNADVSLVEFNIELQLFSNLTGTSL